MKQTNDIVKCHCDFFHNCFVLKEVHYPETLMTFNPRVSVRVVKGQLVTQASTVAGST